MERGYGGGYFVAVDVAQRTILAMLASPDFQHVLKYEAMDGNLRSGPWRIRDNRAVCTQGLLCTAIQHRDHSAPVSPYSDSESARLSRDVARFLVLYVQRRPALVHSFYTHGLKAAFAVRPWQGKCELCNWVPKDAVRCNYCSTGACTTCLSEASYRTCAHGCCKLCPTCDPLALQQGCEVPGCMQLYCAVRKPQICQDEGCKKTLCAAHSQKGQHVCEGGGAKRSRRDHEAEMGDSL
jgi:hypothetical protein